MDVNLAPQVSTVDLYEAHQGDTKSLLQLYALESDVEHLKDTILQLRCAIETGRSVQDIKQDISSRLFDKVLKWQEFFSEQKIWCCSVALRSSYSLTKFHSQDFNFIFKQLTGQESILITSSTRSFFLTAPTLRCAASLLETASPDLEPFRLRGCSLTASSLKDSPALIVLAIVHVLSAPPPASSVVNGVLPGAPLNSARSVASAPAAWIDLITAL